MRSPPRRSTVRTERDANVLNGARMAGAIDPLSYRRHGRVSQNRIAAQHFGALHISLGADGEPEAYGPPNVQALQECRDIPVRPARSTFFGCRCRRGRWSESSHLPQWSQRSHIRSHLSSWPHKPPLRRRSQVALAWSLYRRTPEHDSSSAGRRRFPRGIHVGRLREPAHPFRVLARRGYRP